MRSFRRKFLLILVCIPFHMQAGNGVSDTLKVYFRQNEKQWNQDYRYNGLRLEQFLDNYRRLREEPIFRSKARIHIYSGCSPEGRYKSNMRLLGMRVESLKSVLVEKYDIPDSLIVEDFRGINWEKRRRAAAGSAVWSAASSCCCSPSFSCWPVHWFC